MAINTIALAQKMTTELDKAIVQKSVTGFLTDNAMRAKFVGAGTVLIPDVELQGLGDYDRDTGAPQGSITLKTTSYTLTNERGRSFVLDEQDADESGVPGLAGQIMGEFVRTKVIPEIDAYVLSKLATTATTNNMTVTGTLTNGSFKLFNDACLKVWAALGYDEQLVAFVNDAFYADLMSTSELTRRITISDFKRGDIYTKVQSINGVAILPAPSARMKTSFTFYDGKTDNSASGGVNQKIGGFVPASSANDVGLIVMPKRAASLVKKTDKVRIFSPEVNQDMQAWKFDYRLYYDLIIKDSMKKSIVTYTYSGT